MLVTIDAEIMARVGGGAPEGSELVPALATLQEASPEYCATLRRETLVSSVVPTGGFRAFRLGQIYNKHCSTDAL